MIAITTTVLLYFKAELRQHQRTDDAKDINSILQFAVLSLVILPILPKPISAPTTRSIRARSGGWWC
jgi:uncharacterized membrane protein (DUF4010 family)